MKKIGGDKPIGVVIHTCIEIAQGNSLVATFISNKLKCHVFHFIFSLFSSTKSENRMAEQVLPMGRAGTSGKGEVLGKGSRRVNTVQKMSACVCKCKKDTC
jgi:hypothetical protein